MASRGRERILSKDELDLWKCATRGDKPIGPCGRPQADPARMQHPPLPENRESQTPISVVGQRHASSITHPPRFRSAASFAGETFDFRLKRRLSRGSRDIDARLDLHGLRQQAAYSTLHHFLASSQQLGHRHVLIITGKGGIDRETQDGNFWGSERGVLRRMVPRWLAEPALSIYVVAFTESAARHGGSGALYVTLRTRLNPDRGRRREPA